MKRKKTFSKEKEVVHLKLNPSEKDAVPLLFKKDVTPRMGDIKAKDIARSSTVPQSILPADLGI